MLFKSVKPLFTVFAFLPACAFAANVTLMLDEIVSHRESEKSGDELYFNVTVYGQDRDYSHYQIPSYPAHWYSDHLEDVKDVQLWQQDLAPGQRVSLVISLTERDLPPWNIDDLIGSVKLNLQNVDGKIEEKWSLYADRGHTKPYDTDPSVHQYYMEGDESKYEIAFRLINK